MREAGRWAALLFFLETGPYGTAREGGPRRGPRGPRGLRGLRTPSAEAVNTADSRERIPAGMFRSQRMLATPTGACKALWHQRSTAHVSSKAGVAQDWFATDDTSWTSSTGLPGCLSKHAVWRLASGAAVCVGRMRVCLCNQPEGFAEAAEGCGGVQSSCPVA